MFSVPPCRGVPGHTGDTQHTAVAVAAAVNSSKNNSSNCSRSSSKPGRAPMQCLDTVGIPLAVVGWETGTNSISLQKCRG